MTLNVSDLVADGVTVSEGVDRLIQRFSQYNVLLSGPGEWKYMDILPLPANKRTSLEFICFQRFHLAPNRVSLSDPIFTLPLCLQKVGLYLRVQSILRQRSF